MKKLSALLMLVFSLSALATETRTFFYDGTQDSVNLSLSSEETHTEYRYEQRRTTCYRQDVYYRTQCYSTPRGTICNTIPEYRTVAYSCIQTVRIPYQVKDFDVDANVNLNIASIPEIPAGETFKVTLDGSDLSISAIGSKRFFIILKKKDIASRTEGSVKFIDANYSISLVDAAQVLKGVQVSNISFKDNAVLFKTGETSDLIGYSLNVTKAPIFGSNKVLFERDLSTDEIDVRVLGAGHEASVNLQKLGVELESGRHKITAKAFFKYQGSILNASQFEKTEASQTLVYKVK